MASLNVELHGELVGRLIGQSKRNFDFVADPAALEKYGLGSQVLSVAVPLLRSSTGGKADRRRNYFAELLPEGESLERLAGNLRVPTDDVLRLLAQFGRDVAGAVEIFDPELPGEPKTPALAPVTEIMVAALLRNVKGEPFANAPRRGRTSLAGVQGKIVLARANNSWNRVLDGYPSTHILKPSSTDYPTMIFDEEYGQRICRLLGIANFEVEIEAFDGLDCLVIQRFDRTLDKQPKRIHQEDMNQALGASRNEKYQEYGGKVSLKRVSQVISRSLEADSLTRLLRQVTISLAIGNLDMHAKNISIFHFEDGQIAPTPAYDMVPQTHLGSDGRMALAINNQYIHSQISADDLVAEAESWGMRNVSQEIRDTLERVLSIIASEVPHKLAHPRLREDIAGFTLRLLAGL
ncbi:type II toxin-antitoxin system HipA family toxin [Candidatus Aquiluna sp. UB-MaderosW2red]|uniref:type II toxin-antitoxin system HipA family toxin n=1 Tax=Candidatus Aquiluna sp. UB-MaderosW2red TaxID=1855377 RepID=UPI000875CF26|nr:HipA domain-containing protein [Candidatus Aquiluna sp. UB-MaderosW2red]SCX03684.1 serine/threonine-protein kinase HipA [Candidatus Aquiluna sp. UB-MaderosW2red]